MNKSLLAGFVLVLVLFISGCGSDSPNNTNAGNSAEPDSEVRVSFTGEIVEIHGTGAVVFVKEGEILSSGSRVSVDLSVNNEETFQVGDSVKVVYDGVIRESDPLQINTIAVEKIKE